MTTVIPVAKTNFCCPYGVFQEKRKLAPVSRIPKSILMNWEQQGLIAWVPDPNENKSPHEVLIDLDTVEFEIPPPVDVETRNIPDDQQPPGVITPNKQQAAQIQAATLQVPIMTPKPPTVSPPRTVDLGTGAS